jgi:hypothetical protein
LGIRLASPNCVEPDAQILLEPQMLTFDRYRRKSCRLHQRDGLSTSGKTGGDGIFAAPPQGAPDFQQALLTQESG